MHFEQLLSNTREFTPETYAILAKVHEHLLNNPTKENKFKGLDQRGKLSMATGVSEHAARKAMGFTMAHGIQLKKRPWADQNVNWSRSIFQP
jgi:hypothetical protein